ncbi:MAG: MFS transporter [Verrucomicrobia bacterium]|nr:MFS transporter [Verrucomicrobiota bacterium]
MSHAAHTTPSATAKPLSLGVIFLTLYIDLIGFSIGFPLGPDLLDYYLKLEGNSGALGWILAQTEALARACGIASYAPVLFGGVLASVFSLLQFLFAPVWGGLSDRLGRRPVLLWTVAGTGVGYLLWALSGSFWMFLLSRVVSGAFSGNLSVATAAVADVTSRAERSKAMGLVGAAFGLGLVTGPMLGAFTVQVNLAARFPEWSRWGINPFSVPALVALGLCGLNLVWITARFRETLSPEHRAEPREPRTKNPLRAILSLESPAVRRTNLVAFVFSVAFVAMEATLTFLATQRFGYTARDNGLLLGFLGGCAIFTQGYVVRKMLRVLTELRVLSIGLAVSVVGFVLVGLAAAPWQLYVGVAVLVFGSGLVNPSTTGLISLYASPAEQGRVLGVFRSLGSLARAGTPVLAGVLFWAVGSLAVFVAGALLVSVALGLSRRLPRPEK